MLTSINEFNQYDGFPIVEEGTLREMVLKSTKIILVKLADIQNLSRRNIRIS